MKQTKRNWNLILARLGFFGGIPILLFVSAFCILSESVSSAGEIVVLHLGTSVLLVVTTLVYKSLISGARAESLVAELKDFCHDPALYEPGQNRQVNSTQSLLEHAARRFSSPLNRLRFSLPQIEFTAETLQDFSEQFQSQARLQADMSSETLSTAEEMSASNLTIAQAAEGQKERVSATRGSVERLTAELQKMHKRLEGSAEITRELTEKADQGEAAMRALLEANEESNRRTSEIQHVLDIINEVAERTNLLSLNASIEAARAGDAGRGFAVVAQEISHLAAKTSDSVQQIARSVQLSLDTIRTTVEKARRTGDLFGQLTVGLKEQNANVLTVVREASDQNRTIEEISSITGLLSQQSQHILEATSEQARAMDSLSQSFQRVSVDADLLSFRSTELEAIRSELMRIGKSLRESWEFYNAALPG